MSNEQIQENNEEKEDPQEVEAFVRSLLSNLDILKRDILETIDKPEEVVVKTEVKVEEEVIEVAASGDTVEPEMQPKPEITSIPSPTASKPSITLEGKRPSIEDRAEIEKYVRNLLNNLDVFKEEAEKIMKEDKPKVPAGKKSDTEERESTHRFIRSILESIDIFKAIQKQKKKEKPYPYGYYDGFGVYQDGEYYYTARSEEEEEGAVEIKRPSKLKTESLGSICFKCICMENGDIYEGECVQGKRHGRGFYCFKNGARYDGFWKKGLKHGKGQFLYPDSSKYIGYWKKDLKHGQGTYYYRNGDTYEGNWHKGLRHGLGTYTYKSVNVTHYGTWKYGCMEGPGILNYPHYKYHGNFENNLPKGPGCFVFDGKYMYHGYYVHQSDPTIPPEPMCQEKEFVETEGMMPPLPTPIVGMVSVWKGRQITKYSTDLLPPEPVPLLIKESQESMVDIIEYLQLQYAGGRPTLGRRGRIGRPCW